MYGESYSTNYEYDRESVIRVSASHLHGCKLQCCESFSEGFFLKAHAWLSFSFLGSDFEVDYESEENAQVVYSALAVDKEVLLRDAPIPTNFLVLKLL